MMEMKEISYVRFGTRDLQLAESFATSCLGLAVGDRSKKSLYLRSDDRAHTLCYTEGNPDEQAVGFEVDSEENLQAAAATLEALGHPVHGGAPAECAARMGKGFIALKEPPRHAIRPLVPPGPHGPEFFPT